MCLREKFIAQIYKYETVKALEIVVQASELIQTVSRYKFDVAFHFIFRDTS